jgi:hypothetical protein
MFSERELREYIGKADATGSIEMAWNTGVRKSNIQLGARVFLTRVGVPPRGLCGSGVVISEPYESEHFAESKRKQGIKTWYILGKWDKLSPKPILTKDQLIIKTGETRLWSPQGGGVEIPSRTAATLEEIWTDAIKRAAEPAAQLTIPKPRPAALEPFWHSGILTVSDKPIKTDLSRKLFKASLSALQADFRDLLTDIDNNTNIDRRFRTSLASLIDRISDKTPSQIELFRLGHAQEYLTRYGTKVNEEWPSELAARYHSALLSLNNTLRQSPEWREFRQNATKETLNNEQIEQAINLAQEASNELRAVDAAPFVDYVIPGTLEGIIREQGEGEIGLVAQKNETLASDLIESVNNILKQISAAALTVVGAYISGFGRGFTGAARRQGPIDGKKAFKWLRRVFIAASGSSFAAGTLSHLLTVYPHAFSWLENVLKALV